MKFRPIFIINVAKLKKLKADHEYLIQMSCYLIQFLITRGLVSGKVENWVTIIDMKGVGMLEIPKKLLQAMSKPLQQYFKGRLYRLHIINAQWAIKICWKLAKKLVDPLTIKKFALCGDDFNKKLSELIHPDSLEKRFGGNLPDKEDNFFPP